MGFLFLFFLKDQLNWQTLGYTKKKKTSVNKIISGRGDITVDSTEIKGIIKNYYE